MSAAPMYVAELTRRRYRESSGSSDRRIAVALLKRRIAEVIEGRVVGHRADRVTFAELVALVESDYTVQGRKSLPLLKYRLTRLKAAFGSTRPVDITYRMLSAYVEQRLGEGAQRGLLLSSGLITGEALVGIGLAVPIVISGRGDVLAIFGVHGSPWPGVALLLGFVALLYRLSLPARR